jgi:hypothetical protein
MKGMEEVVGNKLCKMENALPTTSSVPLAHRRPLALKQANAEGVRRDVLAA